MEVEQFDPPRNLSRQIRLKIITNRGINFVTAVRPDSTISDLASRALNVYLELSDNPKDSFINRKQLTVSAVKQGIFHLPKSQYVFNLLRKNDQVEMVIVKAKPKYPNNFLSLQSTIKLEQPQEEAPIIQVSKTNDKSKHYRDSLSPKSSDHQMESKKERKRRKREQKRRIAAEVQKKQIEQKDSEEKEMKKKQKRLLEKQTTESPDRSGLQSPKITFHSLQPRVPEVGKSDSERKKSFEKIQSPARSSKSPKPAALEHRLDELHNFNLVQPKNVQNLPPNSPPNSHPNVSPKQNAVRENPKERVMIIEAESDQDSDSLLLKKDSQGYRRFVDEYCIDSPQSELMIEQEQSHSERRNERMNSIRMGLKTMPAFRKNTDHIKETLAKTVINTSALSASIELQLQKSESVSEKRSEKSAHKFEDDYVYGDKIGEGAHGVVKICQSKHKSSERYAVKIMALDDEHIYFLKNNFRAIQALKHPSIVRYINIYFDLKKNVCQLVMELVDLPNLLQLHIESEDQLKQITYSIICTLKYLHAEQICHRDIKPENILYCRQTNEIKLIDFGISKKVVVRNQLREMLTLTGTPYYRAPEMFQGGGYDQKVDLWALGITIYKLMTGVTPFESEYHSDTITNIIKGEFSFPKEVEDKYSKFSKNLVQRLLRNKTERLTAAEASHDLWFFALIGHEEITRSANFSFDRAKNFILGEMNSSQMDYRKMSYNQMEVKGQKSSQADFWIGNTLGDQVDSEDEESLQTPGRKVEGELSTSTVMGEDEGV